MKVVSIGCLVLAGLMLTPVLLCAQAPSGSVAPSGQKSLAATLNVYVFPTAGQEAAQQSQDEGD